MTAIESVKDYDRFEYMESMNVETKEGLLYSLKVSLFESNTYKRKCEELAEEQRSLKIEYERLQRECIRLKQSKLLQQKSPSENSNKENVVDDDVGIDRLRRKPILANKQIPVIPNTKASSSRGNNTSGDYLPDGRGGSSRFLNINGRTVFF